MSIYIHVYTYISRASDQNGVSLLYIMLEIHHSGREPLIYIHQHVQIYLDILPRQINNIRLSSLPMVNPDLVQQVHLLPWNLRSLAQVSSFLSTSFFAFLPSANELLDAGLPRISTTIRERRLGDPSVRLQQINKCASLSTNAPFTMLRLPQDKSLTTSFLLLQQWPLTACRQGWLEKETWGSTKVNLVVVVVVVAICCSLFLLFFYHTSPLTWIFFIILFNQYPYSKLECDYL